MTKKKLLTLLLAFISYMSAMAAVSLEQAKTKVKDYVSNTLKLKEYRVMYNSSSSSSILLMFNKKSVTVPSDSWMFFIDDMPDQDWAHDCHYAFVSKSTGAISVSKNLLPPSSFNGWTEFYTKVENEASELSDGAHPNLIDWNLYSNTVGSANSRCHAILISGGWDSYNNHQRYWNNCSMVYQMLTKCYGFSTSNINVLMSDGTNSGADLHLSNGSYINSPLDLDGNGRNDIQYPAKKSYITHVFDSLKVKLTSSDELFIYVTDHGDSDGSICLWGESITPADFAKEVDKVNFLKSISLVMVQCYSGAHISTLKKAKRTIITAARHDETAKSTYDYSKFGRRWVEAMAKYDAITGNSCNPDKDNDFKVSMLESFKYAYSFKSSDAFNSDPQYWSDECFGEKQYLDGLLVDTKSLCCTLSSNALRKADSRITSTTKITRANVEYQTYGDIILKSGFSISDGAKFTAKILACRASNTTGSLRSADIDLEYDNEEFDIDPEITDVNEVISETEKISVYPNPTDGILNISVSNGSIDNIVVTDITGNELMNQAVDADQAEIDLSAYNKGLYLVKILTENDSYTKKVVLK